MEKMENLTHKNHCKPRYLIILMVCMLLVTPILVSGLEFDNVKEDLIIDETTSNYGRIEIKDWFGILDLATLELKVNTNKCLVDCSAKIEIIMYQEGKLIDEVRFMRLQEDDNWKEEGIKSYEFYIQVGEKEKEIDDYEYQCIDGKYNSNNNSYEQICTNIKIGSHIERELIWELYNINEEVLAGTYYIKLKGKKKSMFDIVDWQITSQGKLIDDWAIWDTNAPIAYYDFNSTTVLENLVNGSEYNGTLMNSPTTNVEVTFMPKGYSFDLTQNEWINITNISFGGFQQSINMWIQPNFTSGTCTSGEKYLFRDEQGAFSMSEPCDGTNRLEIGDVSISGINTTGWWQAGEWVMVTVIWDTAKIPFIGQVYINSTLVINITGGSPTSTTGWLAIGAHDNGITTFGGNMSEIGIWNTTLTTAEIDELFNGGSGLAYEDEAVLVTLDYPADNSVSITNSVEFNCSATALGGTTLVNMSLWHNGTGTFSLNQTIDVTGTTNSTNFTSTFIDYSNILWNCQACDSNDECEFASANRTVTISNVIVLNETYINTTNSGIINEFLLELETDGTQVTIGYLNYNNTNILGSISSSGNYYNLTRNQIATGVSISTNISFHWNITLEDGYNFVTSSKNQTVNPIIINESCGAGMYVIFNFTMVDEITQTKLDGAVEDSSIKVDLDLYTLDRTTKLNDFYQNFSKTNPVEICIDNNLSGGEQYSIDAQVQYGATNYSSEFYNIERYVLNSSTLSNNITLYNLDTTHTQDFRLIARDTSYLPIDGALIQIERKYVDDGVFYITEIPKTDEKGITSASLQLNDVIYNFFIYQSGVLISSFTNVLAICQTPLVSSCEIDFNAFSAEIEIPNYEEGDDFNFTLNYNDTSDTITSQFVIPSGEPSIVYLEVIREDTLGTAVCSDTLTSASGILSCVVPNSFGNSTIMAKIYKDSVEQGKGSIKTDQQPSDIFGVVLTMMSILVMLTLIGIGVSDSPVITGVFIFVGLILIVSMNLVKNTGFIGATATILFFAIATILVIIKAARRS